MECGHENRTVVWTDVAVDGYPLQNKVLRHQCMSCGMLFGNSLPKTMALPDTPWVDKWRLNKYRQEEAQKWKEVRQARSEMLNAELMERRAKHAAYLQTEGWRAKRKLVLARAAWLCEGCRINRATQVHHLTYVHWGKEFLWELVAICDECHERAHEDREPDTK